MKKIAVILCGSGYRDGSEIREAVATLWALSQHSIEFECFAPNENQFDVVNCLTGESQPHETRNQLVEAARIARGKIKPLNQLKTSDFAAVILPGGFGAAKNLCSFARAGSNGQVYEPLAAVLKQFHQAQKPIGAICIAPAILALTFKNQGFELTVGAVSDASREIEKLGHHHKICSAQQCHVDLKNKVVTTPAYMYDDGLLHEIFQGIEQLVRAVIKLA